jgi:hypothetical protein
MRPFLNDLTVFIISSEEDTYNECICALEKQTVSFKIEVIKNISPMSRAFNRMHEISKTPLFIQVDADVILEPWAVEFLYNGTKHTNFLCCAAYGQLYEEGFGVGGAVRCWKKHIFSFFKFKDVRTVDRNFYKRTRWFLIYRKDLKKVIGRHVPRHSYFSEYLKTKSDMEKWQFLGRKVEKFALPLVIKLLKDINQNRYKLLGATLAILSSKEHIFKSKNMQKEQEILLMLTKDLGLDFDNLKLKDFDIEIYIQLLAKNYLNFSTKNYKEFWVLLLDKELSKKDLETFKGIVS